MKHVGWGVFLRDIVHVEDVRTCITASRHYAESKGWLRLHYMKRIVSSLTGRRAWLWQVRLINRLMVAAGFKPSQETSAEDAVTSLDRVCTWIGARLNMTREAVARQLTIDEIPKHVCEIMKRDLERSLSMIKAQHLPDKFSEEILSEMKKLQDEVQENTRKIEKMHRTVVEKDRYGRKKNTLIAGVMQPC